MWISTNVLRSTGLDVAFESRRPRLVGDAAIAAAEDQDLDELVKDDRSGCAVGGSCADGWYLGESAGLRIGPRGVRGWSWCPRFGLSGRGGITAPESPHRTIRLESSRIPDIAQQGRRPVKDRPPESRGRKWFATAAGERGSDLHAVPGEQTEDQEHHDDQLDGHVVELE
jgi:hypothetical protein